MSTDAIIRKFLVEEQGCSLDGAEYFLGQYKKFDDIYNEFLGFIGTRTIEVEKPVESSGWTAKKLLEKLPHLEVQVIYEFMVGLREKPEEFKDFIEMGAPTL